MGKGDLGGPVSDAVWRSVCDEEGPCILEEVIGRSICVVAGYEGMRYAVCYVMKKVCVCVGGSDRKGGVCGCWGMVRRYALWRSLCDEEGRCMLGEVIGRLVCVVDGEGP